MWKLETTAKGNFVYVSQLKQQGNSHFKFISVSFSAITVSYIRYQNTDSLNSYGSSFYIKKKQKNISIEEKLHSGLFLSSAITGIDVKDTIRYPNSSLKYHLTGSSLKYHLTSILIVY